MLIVSLYILLSSSLLFAQTEDNLYAVRDCESESSVIQIDISTGRSSVVYSPPNGHEIFDVFTASNSPTLYAAVSAQRWTSKPYLVRVNMLDGSETIINYDARELDYEFAVSGQNGQIVFMSSRPESTGVGVYLLEPETYTVSYLTNVAYFEGGYPQWAPDSQEVWFVDVDYNGWHIASVDIDDPEDPTRRIVGDGVIRSFAIRSSDRQLSLVGDHLMDVEPSTDVWSGINVFDQNDEITLQTGIRAIDVLYISNDLYYTQFDRMTGLYSISRLNTESGQTDLIYETTCRLWL